MTVSLLKSQEIGVDSKRLHFWEPGVVLVVLKCLFFCHFIFTILSLTSVL